MVLIYGAIALVMRGVLVVNDGVHFKVRRQQDRIKPDLSDADDEDERRSKAVANLMMLYVDLVLIRLASDISAVILLCVHPASCTSGANCLLTSRAGLRVVCLPGVVGQMAFLWEHRRQ